MRKHSVAVCIPAMNEEVNIGATIRSVAESMADHRVYDYHLVVALDSCTDATGAVVGEVSTYARDEFGLDTHRLHLVEGTWGSPVAARDAAFRKAIDLGADSLLSTDADCSVAESWVYRMMNALRGNVAVGLVTSWVRLDDEDGRLFNKWEQARDEGKLCGRFFEANFATDARLYATVGGFDTKLKTNAGPGYRKKVLTHGYLEVHGDVSEVITSSRTEGRIPGKGMADILRKMK